MKRVISLVLCVVMMLSVFSVLASAASKPDLNKAVEVKSSGFVNGKVTYTIYLKPNVKLTGAIFHIKFDPAVLEPVMSWSNGGTPDYAEDDGMVFADNGAYVTKDKYGDKNIAVPGVYASGMVYESKNTCTVSYVSLDEYKNGSTKKPFMSFAFKVVSSDRPVTNVEFSCIEFRSSDSKLNYNPENRAPLFITKDTTSTLNKIKLTGVTSVKTGLKIQWSATKGASGYRIYKADSKGKLVKHADVGSGVTSFVDTKATPNVKSTYTVRALDANGKLDSQMGEKVSGVYVKAPQNITLAVKADGVNVSWTKVSGASSYKLYRREINSNGKKGSWLFLSTVKNTKNSYLDKEELESGMHYEYTVVTYVGTNKSSMYTFADTWFYKAPTVKLSSITGGLRIGWNGVSGAQTYKVYRKYSGEADWTCIGTVKAGTLKFIDTKAITGKQISYAVRAFGKNGSSWFVAQSITYVATPTLKSVANVSTGVQLKWSSVKNAKSYVVMRKTGNSNKWVQIATVTGTAYTDKTVSNGKTYKYTVKAVNGKNASGYNSAGLSIKYIATPKLTKISNVAKGVNVKWDAVNGATGYIVFRKDANSSAWKKLAEIKGTTYTDKNVKNKASYTYTVKAVAGQNVSGFNKGLTIKCTK